MMDRNQSPSPIRTAGERVAGFARNAANHIRRGGTAALNMLGISVDRDPIQPASAGPSETDLTEYNKFMKEFVARDAARHNGNKPDPEPTPDPRIDQVLGRRDIDNDHVEPVAVDTGRGFTVLDNRPIKPEEVDDTLPLSDEEKHSVLDKMIGSLGALAHETDLRQDQADIYGKMHAAEMVRKMMSDPMYKIYGDDPALRNSGAVARLQSAVDSYMEEYAESISNSREIHYGGNDSVMYMLVNALSIAKNLESDNGMKELRIRKGLKNGESDAFDFLVDNGPVNVLKSKR